MGDQRYRYSTSGRRSPTMHNPARMSLPSSSGLSVGYSSLYGGDIHVIPTSRQENTTAPRHHSHHHSSSDYRGSSVTPTTTTTYTVRKDPVSRTSGVRDHSRTRRSTFDTANKRPPIIVTTRQTKEPSTSQTPSSARPASPAFTRDTYRPSDEGQYYAQPASSIRSRSHTRNSYSAGGSGSTLDNEEFLRLRQRTGDGRLASTRNETHRERPTSIYAEGSRHSSTAADIGGDSGYEYTTPSALARYDLDNDKPSQRRRRDSFDRSTYYRPSVSVSTDINRPFDGRSRGPPPTTWGLDKVNRRVPDDSTGGIYDRPQVRMPVPPVIPLPVPDLTHRSGQLDVSPSPHKRQSSRTRPVSLYQDGPPRAMHHDDSYRTRDDGQVQRESRGRQSLRDDNVGGRGFGLRVENDKKDDMIRDRERDERLPLRERRVEPRRDSRTESRDRERERERDREREPKRRSDEDVDRRDDRKESERDRKYSRDTTRKDDDARSERKGTKDDHGRDDDRDKGKLRDKVATGLSLAAGAIGLTGALSGKEKDDKEEKGSPKRRTDLEEERRRDEEERHRSNRREPEERKTAIREDKDAFGPEKSRKDRDFDEVEARDRSRRDTEAKLNGEAADNSSSEECKLRRRQRHSSVFRPSDTASLMALKEQLKAKEELEKENQKVASKEPSPSRDLVAENSARSSKEELRGRETSISAADDKQVRVLSPPRDKDDKRPIKGILKQPKPQFPEEPNPVREGVAPHKDDKTKSNVPPGARWTKISRKLVNPEALTIGKERFEVRDDFVIILRVLNKDEIQAYTAATAQLRDMRRKEFEKEHGGEREDDDDDDSDSEGRRRVHRSHRKDPRDQEEDEKKYREDKDRERERRRDRDRDDDRSRRYRHEDDEEPRPRALEYHQEDDYPRSYRHREREREREPVPIAK